MPVQLQLARRQPDRTLSHQESMQWPESLRQDAVRARESAELQLPARGSPSSAWWKARDSVHRAHNSPPIAAAAPPGQPEFPEIPHCAMAAASAIHNTGEYSPPQSLAPAS